MFHLDFLVHVEATQSYHEITRIVFHPILILVKENLISITFKSVKYLGEKHFLNNKQFLMII